MTPNDTQTTPAAAEPSQAPAVQAAKSQPATVRGWIESADFQAQIAKALPKHLTPDRMIRVALTALTRTPKLADCTPQSVCKCLLDLSAAGLEPDGRRAHLIPYGKEATLVIDYKGKVELMMRSGTVSNIHADVVCDADEFEANTGRVTHRINYRAPRGDAYAVYCIIRFKDGGEKSEVMTRDEIEAIRKRSRAGQSGPWVTDWNEMAKKTVFHRASKWVTLSPEIRDLMDADGDVIDIAAASAAPEIRKPLFAAKPVEPVQVNEEAAQ